MANKKMDYQKWENLKGQGQIPLENSQNGNSEPIFENMPVLDNGQEDPLLALSVSTPELYKLKQSLKRWAWWVRLSCYFMIFFSMLDFIVILKNYVWASGDAMLFLRMGMGFGGFVTAWLGIKASKHKSGRYSKWYLGCLLVVIVGAIASLIVSWAVYQPKKLVYENRELKKIEGKLRENVLSIENAEFRADNGLQSNPSAVDPALEDFSDYVGSSMDQSQILSDSQINSEDAPTVSSIQEASQNNRESQDYKEDGLENAWTEWNYYDYDDWATDSSILSENKKWYHDSKQKLVKSKSSPILSLFNYKLFKQNHKAAAAFSISLTGIISAFFVFFAYKLHNGIKQNKHILAHVAPQENLNYL
ncbi:unnamed protein product [Blepharisma stoltei]|uniref:Uncharacterized protein n=1 Tax=Blepharisma stoltei TaxID=1481888 RepID=A0AAU9JID7_9CILI|nr:unnamed protein product [Blepharisma stoltei]